MTTSQDFGKIGIFYHHVDQQIQEIKKWLWLLPMTSTYVAFLFIPILFLFSMSLFSGVRAGEYEFVGLQNYQVLLTSDLLYTTIKNTFVYTIANTVLTVGGGLILALTLRSSYQWIRSVFQVIYLLPYAIMSVGVAMIWEIMYRPGTGVLASLFERLGVDPGITWLGDTTFALPSVIVSSVWWTVGFYTVIWLVGLSSIDESYYEAAKMDGAGRVATFRYITLPLLKPIGLFLLLISIITSLRVFGLVWVLTRGGPTRSTEVIVTWMYKLGFIENELGVAAALGVVLFVITLAISAINIRVVGIGGQS